MKKIIPILILLLVIISCKKSGANENEKLKSADWLLGKWENKTADGTLSENWEKLNDSTFQATSYFIKDKDTLHSESIKLQQVGEELIYNATVQGQNNDKAVPFKMTTVTEKQVIFENPKHDYPQKISYDLLSKEKLKATISGLQLGKPSSESYNYQKTK